MSLKNDLINESVRCLTEAGIEAARYETQLLLSWAVGCDRMGLWRLSVLSPEQERRFRTALARRVKREPMAFILGQQGFWTLDFEVSPDTLIPRSDSESLIEALLLVRPERDSVASVLDLGTGTGCLLLATLSEYPTAFGIGVDVSPSAAFLAQRNARKNALAQRAAFLSGFWAEAIEGPFDVVLSNPPYIEKAVLAELMPEVLEYEPQRALDGGTDGLDAYRVICAALPRLLGPSGCAVLELGIGQEVAVTALAQEYGLQRKICYADLGEVPRALVLSFC